MAVVSQQKTLSTTASIIAAAGSSMADKVTCVVKKPSALIYIGGSDVTTTNGMPVDTTDAIALDLGPGDILYAIASAATPTVQVLLTRQ